MKALKLSLSVTFFTFAAIPLTVIILGNTGQLQIANKLGVFFLQTIGGIV
jgi:hypothetical protein